MENQKKKKNFYLGNSKPSFGIIYDLKLTLLRTEHED